MFSLNSIKDPLHARLYRYGAIGFAALSFGYLLRAQLTHPHPLVSLLLGIFPNLLGSFATPFMLALLLARRFPALGAVDRFPVFFAVNLFTFVTCLLIEQLHVLFQLGTWDPNDIIASAIGGFASLGLFSLTKAMMKKPA